jgi:hypothetical protein
MASVVGCGLGCRAGTKAAADTASATASAPVAFTPPDSATLREATAALGDFLEASREGSPTRGSLARLTACPGGGGPAQGPMLATFELLPAASRADTVVGRAVVTTVAEQDVDRQHRGYYVVRLRVRRDTLEWDVLRSESGNWVVCNGLRFGLTAPDSLTTWRPTGASRATARALADSVANATAK